MFLIAGSVLAFGGVYPWGIAAIAVVVTALLLSVRPHLPSSDRLLDTSLLAAIGVTAAYLVPVPWWALESVAARRLALWDALALGPRPVWLSLSLSPADTLQALCIFASAVGTFFCCRAVLAEGGVRRVSRAIIWTGFALACAGLIQRVTSPALIYGFWRPEDTGATPFGPFINRNHGAGWIVMALALSVGGFMARAAARGGDAHRRFSVDGRMASSGVATLTMVLALVWSLSRSAMLAAFVAALGLSVGTMARGNALVARSAAVLTVTAGLFVLLWGDLVGALTRVGHGLGGGPFDRPAIWRDTWSMISDSPAVGTGPGTFRTGMLYYQTADHTYIFNQAHNHVLQVLAEGGLLLAVPVACATGALVISAWRRLREDHTRLFWIRAGAAAGLGGIAAQSLLETTLSVPAASQLAAVLAALLLCRPPLPASRTSLPPTAPPSGARERAHHVQERQRQTSVAPIRRSDVRNRGKQPFARELRPASHAGQ